MRYAVNLADMQQIVMQKPEEAVGLRVLIFPVVDRNKLIACEPGQMGGDGLGFVCDEQRAQAVIGVIRKKFQPHELRCYSSQTGNTWKRI